METPEATKYSKKQIKLKNAKTTIEIATITETHYESRLYEERTTVSGVNYH